MQGKKKYEKKNSLTKVNIYLFFFSPKFLQKYKNAKHILKENAIQHLKKIVTRVTKNPVNLFKKGKRVTKLHQSKNVTLSWKKRKRIGS